MRDSVDDQKDVRVHQRDDPGEHEGLAVLPMNDSVHPDFSRAQELISLCVSLGSPRLNAAVGSDGAKPAAAAGRRSDVSIGAARERALVLAPGSTVLGVPTSTGGAAAQRPATTRMRKRLECHNSWEPWHSSSAAAIA